MHNIELKMIYLEGNSIIDVPSSTFQNNSGLEILDMSGNKINSIHQDTFMHNIELKELHLEGNSIRDVHSTAFRNNSRLEVLDMSGNEINSIHRDTFIHNPELKWLYLKQNSISDVNSSTFRNNSRLLHLYMSENKISSIHSDTFIHNTKLEILCLKVNNINEVLPSTFRNNSKLEHLDLSTNLLKEIHSDTFQHNVNLKFLSLGNNILDIINTSSLLGINPTYLDLSGNRIKSVDNSVFRKHGMLETLNLSGNMLQSLGSSVFKDCTNLRYLSLSENSLSEINKALFFGLEYLKYLDLSNNKIEKLNPRVFDSYSSSAKRQRHQVSRLSYINLAQNNIQTFNFDLYFPISSNSVSSNPTFQLDYLNVSSNRLTTLDVASMQWLNRTTAVTDLTANPWNCECSVLLEVWRGLKHKLTLQCASPRELEGKSWDVMEGFCSQPADDRNYTSRVAPSPDKERKEESEVSKPSGSPFILTITLIVSGVVLVCAIGGGVILVKVVKKRRNKPNNPEYEYDDVYVPRASYISVHSYEEVGPGRFSNSDYSYADVRSDSNMQQDTVM
jgi:Leucine-rich repeat (LRR) protein